ncbi:MAG: hypothetical protein J6W60_00990 [Treponema sp.]|nr:hypothetical protein [Treponema sp.]MBP5751420.1 hypothetical protein [Treponema sp.]
MLALIPNKDTANFLSSAARKILFAFNSRQKLSAIPLFPLWANLDKALVKPSLMTVFNYKISDSKLFFPVEVIDGKERIETKIEFGKIWNQNLNESSYMELEEIKDLFPAFIRVFKTGNAVFEDGSWKVYDEKWFKCRD